MPTPLSRVWPGLGPREGSKNISVSSHWPRREVIDERPWARRSASVERRVGTSLTSVEKGVGFVIVMTGFGRPLTGIRHWQPSFSGYYCLSAAFWLKSSSHPAVAEAGMDIPNVSAWRLNKAENKELESRVKAGETEIDVKREIQRRKAMACEERKKSAAAILGRPPRLVSVRRHSNYAITILISCLTILISHPFIHNHLITWSTI